MKTIRTGSGFEIEVKESLGNDAEFFDLVCEADENPLLIRKVLVYMIGEDGRKALYEHLRTDGTVPLDALIREVKEIVALLGKKK